jgi:Mlc titration factor MtfA (ptsG expression regulator)
MKYLLLFILIFFAFRFLRRKKNTPPSIPNEEETHQILLQNVRFYAKLKEEQQRIFLKRVLQFMNQVRIKGTQHVRPLPKDYVYVAASAIIPIFHFTDWKYNNINEVLLYDDAFDYNYNTKGAGRGIAGMVGTGALHRMMILSIKALRAGFEYDSINNTAIHEFVHLLDKADGTIDGLPQYLIPKNIIDPWVEYMREEITNIRSGNSGIEYYAGTNEAEFFAVVSEYFFQKPELLAEVYPDLYDMLYNIYHPTPP